MGILTAAAKAAAKAAKAKKAAAKIAAAKKKAELAKKKTKTTAAAKKAAASKKAKIKKDYAAYVKQFPNPEKVFGKSRLAQKKVGLKKGDTSKFATPKQIRDADKKGMLLANDPDIERKFDEAVEAYESNRLDSFTNPPDRSSAAKRAKAKAAIKSQKPKTKPKKTFESELRALRGKAMTDANRQREAAKLAVKYGRTIRMGGKTFGPKKGPPISRERIPGVKRNKKGEIIDRDGT